MCTRNEIVFLALFSDKMSCKDVRSAVNTLLLNSAMACKATEIWQFVFKNVENAQRNGGYVFIKRGAQIESVRGHDLCHSVSTIAEE